MLPLLAAGRLAYNTTPNGGCQPRQPRQPHTIHHQHQCQAGFSTHDPAPRHSPGLLRWYQGCSVCVCVRVCLLVCACAHMYVWSAVALFVSHLIVTVNSALFVLPQATVVCVFTGQ